jgi:AcrR family transcriptional regulator
VALQRATESFWRAGYSATSLDELSAATGMNRPSLYGAFGDKRELYLAALARYWEISRVAMAEALAYDRPLREALRRLYRKALAGYFGGKDGARGCFAIGTATTEALRDAKIRALLAQGFQMIDDAFAARIRFAREHGDLPKEADPATLAMLASATLHTLAIRSRGGAARSRLEAMADATVEVICGPAAR